MAHRSVHLARACDPCDDPWLPVVSWQMKAETCVWKCGLKSIIVFCVVTFKLGCLSSVSDMCCINFALSLNVGLV